MDNKLKKEDIKVGVVVWWDAKTIHHVVGDIKKCCPAVIVSVSEDKELFAVKSFDRFRDYEIKFKQLNKNEFNINNMRLILPEELSNFFSEIQQKEIELLQKEVSKSMKRLEKISENIDVVKDIIKKLNKDA